MTQNRGQGMGTIVAMGIGAAMGAAAVIFANRDTREKAHEKYGELKERGRKILEKGQDETQKLRDKAEQKKEQITKEAENTPQN